MSVKKKDDKWQWSKGANQIKLTFLVKILLEVKIRQDIPAVQLSCCKILAISSPLVADFIILCVTNVHWITVPEVLRDQPYCKKEQIDV